MNSQTKLYVSTTRTALACFFLYFDVNMGPVSILPAFAGYLLLLASCSLLKEELPKMKALRPLGILLVVWHLLVWVTTGLGQRYLNELNIIPVLIALVTLFFHFAMLRQYAVLAEKYQPATSRMSRNLLILSWIHPVVLTLVSVPLVKFLDGTAMVVWFAPAIVIAGIVVGIWMIVTFFKFRRMFQ